MVDFNTIDDFDIEDKTVLVRIDINSPVDPSSGIILDDTRLKLHAQTVKELSNKGAKVVLLAHQSRPETHDKLVQRICDKILNNRDKICSVQSDKCEDADIIILSYGSPVRSVVEAVNKARDEGKKVGYIKLDTPWPFPEEQVIQLSSNANDVIVVEMNLGQMYYEVDRVLKRSANVHLMGKIGGAMPTPDEILVQINRIGGN